MTRDEMIARQMKATGFTQVACAGFIDQLAGAGIIKLDKPKSADERFVEAVQSYGFHKSIGEQALVAIKAVGLKVV